MQSFFIKLVLYSCAFLPLPLLHLMGSALGLLLYTFPGKIRRISAINIGLCFPELSKSEQRTLLRKSLVETGKTIMETSALWLRPGWMSLRLVREVNGIEHVEHALSAGKGIVLATPHLGAWEAAGLYCAANYAITCLYRPLRMDALENLVRRARNRVGGNYVPANARGVRTLYKTLEEGAAVAMLPDQEPSAGTGTFAPFFGIPAYTMVLLSRLVAKSGAPLVFVWSERLSYGRGYRLHFTPALQETYDSDIETSASAINKSVENMVRSCPSQYQWSYKRFRTRPAGENRIYRQGTQTG